MKLGGMLALLLAALLGAPAAQAMQARPEARLDAECSRLRAELARVHADIARLKAGGRGVREDYQLRQRMADAEALARRLTAAEAHLKGGKQLPAAPGAAFPEPKAAPGDGPVELEAKADLLADQARRFATEAESLVRAARQIRSRQLLRRRAGDLDRDPFAALDGSKRSMAFSSAGARTESTSDPTPANRGSAADQAAPALGAPLVQPAPNPAPTPPATLQLRTLLDPATLAEVQRLDSSSRASADPVALERAATALRLKAQALDTEAKALRIRAIGR